MSQESQKDQSPIAALFQKTHAKMITLQRIDEQFQSLCSQRRKLQDELRDLQSEINVELQRAVDGVSDPAREESSSPRMRAAA
jgi:hypothetical protein